MAYNIIPKTEEDIRKLNFKPEIENEILILFEELNEIIKEPIAIDKMKPKHLKIYRGFQDTLDLKKFKFKYINLQFGNGSRGNRGSNNRGNLFEKELHQNITEFINTGKSKKYQKDIEKILDYIPKNDYPIKCEQMGQLNQKRTLIIESNSITTGKKGHIGDIVTDLDIICSKNTLHLSLKSGPNATLINSGVTKVLPVKEIKEGFIRNKKGQALLDILGLDNEMFCEVFNNYNTKTDRKKVEIDVTNKINKSIFKGFMESVIGYGYILIHKLGNDLHILDMDKETMNDFIKLKKATAIYPLDGSAKRVDIKIELNGMNIKINIRNKQGGLYPTHIMADYKIS